MRSGSAVTIFDCEVYRSLCLCLKLNLAQIEHFFLEKDWSEGIAVDKREKI